MIKSIEVTCSEAFHYLYQQLDLSGKVVATQLKSQTLEQEKVFAFVPDNTPVQSLCQFEGGFYPSDIRTFPGSTRLELVRNDSKPIILEFILKHLESAKENCCLFEDPVSIPSDPYVQKSKIEYVHLNKEMYYFFDNTADNNKVKEAFSCSENYYFLCVLSSLSTEEQKQFIPFASVSLHPLRKLASNTTAFFV